MATPLYTYFFSHTIHKPQFPISSSCSYFLSHFNLKTKQLENSVINSPNSFSISAVSPISDTSRSITSSNSSKTLPFRVGHGFDLHRLEPGYPLIIGGINIPHDRGCEAHSDGTFFILIFLGTFCFSQILFLLFDKLLTSFVYHYLVLTYVFYLNTQKYKSFGFRL